MKEYQINIFVRVVKRKMTEGRTAEEILDEDYPKFTEEEKDEIIARL